MNISPPSPSPQHKTASLHAVSVVDARQVIILIGWLLLCGGLMFCRCFHVSYGFDDIAHLHALAAYRSGEISLKTWLLHNHNEHFLPLVRLYFMAATKLSGLSSSAMHVFTFLNYIAGAFACAWICFSLTRSRLAAFLAGTMFAGAGGFAGSMIWQTSDGEFSIAGTPLIVAIAILVSPHARKRWADAAVLLLIFVSALGLGSMAVGALAIPIYLFLARPDTISPARRKRIILLSASLVIAILLVTKWLMFTHHTRTLHFAVRGIYYGLFLMFSTAGRFLLTWTPFDEVSLPAHAVVSVVAWALIILTFRWCPRPLRQLLLALWAANGLLGMLIGMGRWKIATWMDLVGTDRYHYVFLLPLALQAAAALDHLTQSLLQAESPALRHAARVVLACLLVGALVMSHIRLGKQMEVLEWVRVQHQQEFREAKVLAKIIREKAAKQRLHLAEGPIRFWGRLNIHMGLVCLVFTQFPEGLPNVEWTLNRVPTTSVGSPWDVPPISESAAAIENAILDEWAQKINRAPYSCMINGKMQDVLPVKSCAEAAAMSPPPLAPPKPFW